MKKYTVLGNNKKVTMEVNASKLKIVGNNCIIRVTHNQGDLEVVGNQCKVEVVFNFGSINLVGSNGSVTITTRSKGDKVTIMGANSHLVTDGKKTANSFEAQLSPMSPFSKELDDVIESIFSFVMR